MPAPKGSDRDACPLRQLSRCLPLKAVIEMPAPKDSYRDRIFRDVMAATKESNTQMSHTVEVHVAVFRDRMLWSVKCNMWAIVQLVAPVAIVIVNE